MGGGSLVFGFRGGAADGGDVYLARDHYSSYSRKLLLFGAYVYLITALILVLIDAFFLDAAIWDSAP